jgi:NMD protein affecting ribosome stability and mRNA decay
MDTKELADNISICVECGEKINDDIETKWNKDGEPMCKDCYFIEKLKKDFEKYPDREWSNGNLI